MNCALGDKSVNFGMVLDMTIGFSKTTANKTAVPPGGRFAQYPIWPPSKIDEVIFQLLLAVESCVIPLFPCFPTQGIHF